MRVSVVNRINRRRERCTGPDAQTMRFPGIIYMRTMVLVSCGAVIYELPRTFDASAAQ